MIVFFACQLCSKPIREETLLEVGLYCGCGASFSAQLKKLARLQNGHMFCYIIWERQHTRYVGVTNNVRTRIGEHKRRGHLPEFSSREITFESLKRFGIRITFSTTLSERELYDRLKPTQNILRPSHYMLIHSQGTSLEFRDLIEHHQLTGDLSLVRQKPVREAARTHSTNIHLDLAASVKSARAFDFQQYIFETRHGISQDTIHDRSWCKASLAKCLCKYACPDLNRHLKSLGNWTVYDAWIESQYAKRSVEIENFHKIFPNMRHASMNMIKEFFLFPHDQPPNYSLIYAIRPHNPPHPSPTNEYQNFSPAELKIFSQTQDNVLISEMKHNNSPTPRTVGEDGFHSGTLSKDHNQPSKVLFLPQETVTNKVVERQVCNLPKPTLDEEPAIKKYLAAPHVKGSRKRKHAEEKPPEKLFEIGEPLREFLGTRPGELVGKRAARKALSVYITDNKLRDPDDHTLFNPDEKLAKLLGPPRFVTTKQNHGYSNLNALCYIAGYFFTRTD